MRFEELIPKVVVFAEILPWYDSLRPTHQQAVDELFGVLLTDVSDLVKYNAVYDCMAKGVPAPEGQPPDVLTFATVLQLYKKVANVEMQTHVQALLVCIHADETTEDEKRRAVSLLTDILYE